jgi:hypothetical protein
MEATVRILSFIALIASLELGAKLEAMWCARVDMQLNGNARQSELLPIGNRFIPEQV